MFSGLYDTLSGAYRKHRPHYPAELFAYLGGLCQDRTVAWDCATGNGQAAVGLAAQFKFVWATDSARKQILNANAHPRVAYSQSDCSESGLPPRSVDLVCVAQALHWFGDVEPFYREVERVLRPGGVFAAVCFFQPLVNKLVNQRVAELYSNEAIRRFWYPGFRHIEERYRSLPFPFAAVEPPLSFPMQEEWTWGQFSGYLRTWPHVARAANNGEAVAVRQALGRIEEVWGDARVRHVITWEVTASIAKKQAEPLSWPTGLNKNEHLPSA